LFFPATFVLRIELHFFIATPLRHWTIQYNTFDHAVYLVYATHNRTSVHPKTLNASQNNGTSEKENYYLRFTKIAKQSTI
jgi:hypothetical protein